jgi:pyruvate, water dikinase
LVTDGGGITCHGAVVARELGVPCVVATRIATTPLADGQLVTVDGDRGVVFDSDVAAE